MAQQPLQEKGQAAELLGRGQGGHTAVPSSHQQLLGQEWQRLLAQACPRPQEQAEARAGFGQASVEEALRSQTLRHLSATWKVARLRQGVAGSRDPHARRPMAHRSLAAFGRWRRQLPSTSCPMAPRHQQAGGQAASQV